ncbi:MAG: GNAT family N-acetyltransferase, partial [Thermomicrobiales bacterium]|nr:GNAT family N-acetyltransferase [Thermomicrobiales bacterium]
YGVAVVSASAVRYQIDAWIAQEVAIGHPVAFIIESLEGERVGLAVLSDVQPIDRSAEISIFLESRHRGRGFGADALETLVDAAFHQWNVHRLTVRTEEHNLAAQRFFLAHRFALEGRMREARFIDGAWHDILLFGRVRDETEPRS